MADKRRRLTNLEVREISLVGVGANQPAKVVLFKSADDPTADPATAPSDPLTVTESLSEGEITRIASALAAAVKPLITPAEPATQENKSMEDEKVAAAAAEVEKAAALEAKVKGLEDALKASDAAKAESEAKAETLAKTVAGHEEAIRKAAQEVLVAKTISFVKDAYKALPGVKAEPFALALIAMREKAPEEAKALEVALKAANDAIENSLFRTVGALTKSDEALTAENAYDALVAKIQVANPKVSKETAAAMALDTPEGREIYRQLIAAPAK